MFMMSRYNAKNTYKRRFQTMQHINHWEEDYQQVDVNISYISISVASEIENKSNLVGSRWVETILSF